MLGTITIGGKDRPFKFGWNAIAALGDLRSLDVQGTSELLATLSNGTHTLSVMRDVLFCALASGASYSKLPTDFSNTDVGDWMDEMGTESMAKAMNILGASFSKKKAAEVTQENPPA